MTDTLNKAQIDRQDYVDNTIHDMLAEVIPNHEWDIEIIAEIREVIVEHLEGKGIMSEMEFYPYIELARETKETTMSQLNITIDLENAAFGYTENARAKEVRRILDQIAINVEDNKNYFTPCGVKLTDLNGNGVGRIKLVEQPEDELPKVFKKYPDVCPVCHDSNITAEHFERDGQVAWRKVNCFVCGFVWEETFGFDFWSFT
jgi:hypothetical protein